ncbi:MAG: twitch domain-containing radical SAM protein, partial [Bdellovibrionota bacterium]
PPELDKDQTAVNVTPRIFEIYFTNVCNLSCLYCGPHFSSKWQNENKRNGEFVSPADESVPAAFRDNLKFPQFWEGFQPNKNYDQLLKKFWIWLEANAKHLVFLNVLGGEPLYQKEFGQILDVLEKKPAPGLTLVPITNLMVRKEVLQDYFLRLASMVHDGKLKGVNVTASLDGWGPEAEFTRSGLDLDLWEKNFTYLLRQRWINMSVNIAINPLTIKTLPELIRKIKEWRKTRPVAMSFMTVAYPSEMDIDIFGPGVFDEDFKKILDEMPTENQYDHNYKNYMHGISLQVASAKRKPLELYKLRIFLDEIDRRRGTNWRTLFPWLETELSSIVKESI